MTEDMIISILKSIQKDIKDLKIEQSNTTIQLSAINERQSAQLIAEIGVRTELNEIKSKIQLIEQRLELIN